MQLIYFLTVNYHSAEQIAALIASFPDLSEFPFQLVIVNNSAGDRQLERLRGEGIEILESQQNVGFGRACNLGMEWIFQHDPEALVWLVNPDASLHENLSLRSLNEFFDSHEGLAIVGTAIYTPTGKLWFGGGSFNPSTGAIDSLNLDDMQVPLRSCDWVSGCSTIVNFSCFDRCPHFDPVFFLYYEDFDFCQHYRLLGYKIAFTNQFAVVHTPSSIANRNPFNKLNHSTYSYLLVLERYASRTARAWRFLRVLAVAFALLPIKPAIAFGKLVGVARYLGKSV